MAGGAKRLMEFATHAHVPNFLLHGPSGSGKSSALEGFLRALYGSKCRSPDLVLTVDCARDHGASFVRGDLKNFARSQLCPERGRPAFRSVVVRNADLLTHDAQSALRRSIEVHSHSARFFLLASDTSRLLRPVLSRFCAIHFAPGQPRVEQSRNLVRRGCCVKKMLAAASIDGLNIYEQATKMYDKGVSISDVLGSRAVRALTPKTRLQIDQASRTLKDDRALIAYVLSHLKKCVR